MVKYELNLIIPLSYKIHVIPRLTGGTLHTETSVSTRITSYITEKARGKY